MDDLDDNLGATPFPKVVEDICTPGRDENSTKRAAVGSALVEVIQEKLGADSFEKISPAALFASTLNALNSTVTSDTIDVASSPQLSLLEILRQVVPYVSSSNPNLYLHQFSMTSRALRGVVASIPTISRSQDQSKISSGWNSLLRQCIRTSSTCLNGILVLDNAKIMEKEVLKCFHGTILNHFDDSRAKVRRQAHASALELLLLSKSIGKEGLFSLIPDHMVEYTHHIFDSFIGSGKKKKKKENDFEKKEMIVRLMHLLSFLTSAVLAINVKGRLKIGHDLMKLLNFVISSENSGDLQNSIMVANGALNGLFQIFENSNRDEAYTDKDSSEEDAFCAQQWANLLQANVKIIAVTKNGNQGDGECRTLFSKSIIAIAVRLLSDDISENQQSVMQALAPKLLPLSFTTVINCVGDDNLPKIAVQGICAELARLIRSSGLNSIITGETVGSPATKCIDSCIAAAQKILHYRFRSNWDGCLPCLASLVITVVQGMIPSSGSNEEIFAKMETRVKPLVGGIIQLHDDVDDKGSKQMVESAVESIVQGIGAEIFMGLVNLSEGSKDANTAHGAVSSERAWILNALKASVSTDSSPYRPRLAFFQSHVLGLARKCDSASASDNLTAVEASIQRNRVIDLWSLFPSFCVQPLDIELTFPALAQTMVRAMGDQRYPELLSTICTGLTTISEGVANRQSNNREGDERAEIDKKILSDCSTKILPSLFKLVETLNGVNVSNAKATKDMDSEDEEEEDKKNLSRESQRVMAVTDAIASLAPLAPEQFLKSLFKKVIQRLLAATQSEKDETDKMCTLLGLAQALIKSKSLNDECISLLYRSVKPLINSDEQGPRVQKRAYKLFAAICEHYTYFVTSPERVKEIIDLMVGATMVLQVSARHMRLKCINFIVAGFESNNETQMSIIPNVVGETLLSLKDANSKTREAGYQLLSTMAKVRNDMTTYCQIIVGALAAQTPHMRSAAVMALSRLVFDFARVDMTLNQLVPNLLATVLLLCDENAREVIKSVIGFVRVSIGTLSKEELEPLLPDLVGGILKYNRGKGRFRSKIKIIIKKLVKRYGYDAITPYVPESDARLLTHMRKLAERTARRKAANISDGATAVGDFDQLMDSEEDDSDDGRTFMTGVTGFTKMTSGSRKTMKSIKSMKSERSIAKSVRSMAKSMQSMKSTGTSGPRIDTSGEKSGEIFDMMDSKMNRNVRFQEENDDSDFSDGGEAMEFDDSGKLLIGGDDKINFGEGTRNDAEDDAENADIHRGNKRQRLSKFEGAVAARNEAHVRKNKNKQQQNKTKSLGAAYKSKKAGGDVRKKDHKFEPYAFVPLDGKKYSKKTRGKTVEEMSTVVKGKGGFKRKRR